jgi:hypothetical protein
MVSDYTIYAIGTLIYAEDGAKLFSATSFLPLTRCLPESDVFGVDAYRGCGAFFQQKGQKIA